MKKDLIARLNEGPVLCAEGYLFAMERRGYLQAELVMPYRAEIFMQRFMIHWEFVKIYKSLDEKI